MGILATGPNVSSDALGREAFVALGVVAGFYSCRIYTHANRIIRHLSLLLRDSGLPDAVARSILMLLFPEGRGNLYAK